MFPPDLSQTTIGHLQALIDRMVPEGQSVEYKRELSGKKGQPDAWMAGEGKISDHARNEVLEQVCAFANADGGHLVLGMDETGGRSSRPRALCPIPNVDDLARRLAQQIQDLIQPDLLHVEVAAVRTGADGSGAVVVRVPASGMAPHRVESTKEAFQRRGDNSMTMTMRDIQQLALQRSVSLDRRLERVAKAAADFNRRFDNIATGGAAPCIGLHAIGVPISSIGSIPRLAAMTQGFPYWKNLRVSVNSGELAHCAMPSPPLVHRPILRGVAAISTIPHWDAQLRAFRDGTVEYGIIGIARNEMPLPLYSTWVTAHLSNLVFTIQELRLLAAAPTAEYAIGAYFVSRGGPLNIVGFNPDSAFGSMYAIDDNQARIDPVTLGPIEEIHQIVTSVITDLYHASGEQWTGQVQIEPPLEILTRWEQAGVPFHNS